MLARRLLPALVVSISAVLVCPPTSAGIWNTTKEPAPWRNHWGRRLGLGWSDGYHAYGSISSWRPPAVPSRHWIPWGHAAMVVSPAIQSVARPRGTPRPAESPQPRQATRLRRLPPVSQPQR